MITSWDIYLITRLGDINFVFGIATIAAGITAGILLAVSLIIAIDADPEGAKPVFKNTIRVAAVFFMLSLVGTLIPTTKEAIAIYAIPKIANNESAQQIPVNFAKLINKKLQEWMADVEIIPKEKP